jgi:hypothetical protein
MLCLKFKLHLLGVDMEKCSPVWRLMEWNVGLHPIGISNINGSSMYVFTSWHFSPSLFLFWEIRLFLGSWSVYCHSQMCLNAKFNLFLIPSNVYSRTKKCPSPAKRNKRIIYAQVTTQLHKCTLKNKSQQPVNVNNIRVILKSLAPDHVYTFSFSEAAHENVQRHWQLSCHGSEPS